MKERIRAVRKAAGLSQTAFGAAIGVTMSAEQKWELGASVPSDAAILNICTRFGVREEWLRDGIEPMYGDRSREAALTEEVGRMLAQAPDSFKAALVTTLLRYDPDGPEWQVLEAIYRSVAAEMEKEPE